MSEGDNKMTRGNRVRDTCSAALLVLAGVAVSVGGFLLHPAAGCFLLGGAMAGLAWLLQRDGGDGL